MSNDFYDWKRHPITQVVMSEFQARVNALQEKLIGVAEMEHTVAAETAGAIKAYRDIINIEFSELEEPQQ